MPQHHMVIPHYMGKNKDANVESKIQSENHGDLKRQDSFSVRFSPRDIPLLLPQEGDEQQVSNGDHKLHGEDTFQSLPRNSRRSGQNINFSFCRNKDEHSTSDMPMRGFVDDLVSTHSQKKHTDVVTQPAVQDQEWWETQERSGQIISSDEAGQVGPCTPCQCQVGCLCYSLDVTNRWHLAS